MTDVSECHTNPEQTFDNFVCTEENAAAYGFATVVSLSYHPSRSPLLLCGPKQSGKTHLLNAIVNQWRRFEPKGKLQFVGASTFLSAESLDKRLMIADLLLVDDLEAIAGSEIAQDLLRITCETLRIRGKQSLLAIETGTAELSGISMKLVDFFNSGVSVMLGTPQSSQTANTDTTNSSPIESSIKVP